MRTYGRITNENGTKTWIEVTTDPNGFDDGVWLTTLAQVIKLSRGESPFYANFGIPAQQSVVTQVLPDYYMMETQSQFAPFFASLSITRVANASPPAYNVKAVTHSGAFIDAEVPT